MKITELLESNLSNGSFVKIKSGIEQGYKGVISKIYDDGYCLVALDAGGEFETRLSNLEAIQGPTPSGPKRKKS